MPLEEEKKQENENAKYCGISNRKSWPTSAMVFAISILSWQWKSKFLGKWFLICLIYDRRLKLVKKCDDSCCCGFVVFCWNVRNSHMTVYRILLLHTLQRRRCVFTIQLLGLSWQHALLHKRCLKEKVFVTLQHRFPSCSCFCVPSFFLFLLA